MKKSLVTEPLVTVGVIAYNSQDTIIDTLDSIRHQSYPLGKIELLIADDCSKDKTVQLAGLWIKKYGSLFDRVLILKSEKNQGISHNMNQAIHAARGQYFKGIAADDLLQKTCIYECVEYMFLNPETTVLFSRLKPFGTDNNDYARLVREMLDKTFFKKAKEEQLRYLIFYRNCLPAPTAFMRMAFLKENEIECDERIPFMEDYPLWINMLKAGAIFACIDKEIVLYRIGGISSNRSENYFRSERLFTFYYRYQDWLREEGDEAIKLVVEQECELLREINRIKESKAYRIGKMIVKPFSIIKNYFKRNHKN